VIIFKLLQHHATAATLLFIMI